MNKKKGFFIFKILLYQVVFLLLHYLYDWFPNQITQIFSGINESVFQHMKIGFFSYLVVALIEFLIIRKQIQENRGFWTYRTFTACLYPFFMFFFFFVGPLIFVRFETDLAEILFANACLICSSLCALTIEKQLENTQPSKGFKVIAVTLFTLWIAHFVVFTHRLPWTDVFATPPGWE